MARIISLALAAGVALTLLGATAAQAQPYPGPPPPGPGYRPGPGPWGPPGPHWRHWNRGDRFAGPRYRIDDWRRYSLPPPAPGYGWYRSGGEFVQIGGNGFVGNVFISPRYP